MPVEVVVVVVVVSSSSSSRDKKDNEREYGRGGEGYHSEGASLTS